MHTHKHSSTWFPLCHNQSAPPTGAKRQMSLNPDLAPRGASRFITVVRATLQGVFQVSLVMEKVTPLTHTHTSLYHWIWIVPCGYAPIVRGALLSPIMLKWQEHLAGRSLVGEVIDNFSCPRDICSFSSNNFDRLCEDQLKRQPKARRFFSRMTTVLPRLLLCLICRQRLHLHLPAFQWGSQQDRQLGEWGLINAPLDR